MKKAIAVITTLTLSLSAAVGVCATSYAAEPEYVIKVADASNPEDNCVRGFVAFEEYVEEKSEGRIDVQIFDSGQLGSQSDYLDSMQMGTIQIAEVNATVLSSLVPSFDVFSLPYLSKDMDNTIAVLNEKGLGELLDQKLQDASGIGVLGWMVRTPRCVYSSRGPINTVDDFKGLKIRVMESPIMSAAMEALGAVPVPLSANERYMALQTGVVDAAEGPISLITAQKEYEVTKYLSITNHFITPCVEVMDMNFFNSLPEDLQQIVLEGGQVAAEEEIRLDKENEESAKAELAELGMEINDIEDITPFVDAVTPLYEQYADSVGQDVLDYFLNS